MERFEKLPVICRDDAKLYLNLYICQISCIYCISARWYRKRGSKAVPKMWVPLEFCSCAWAVIGTSTALNKLALEMKKEIISEVVCALPLPFWVVLLKGPLNFLVSCNASQHVALPLLQKRRHLRSPRMGFHTALERHCGGEKSTRPRVWGCTALKYQIAVYYQVDKPYCILLCHKWYISYMFKQMQS